MILEDELPRFFDWFLGPSASTWWQGSLFIWLLVGLTIALAGIVLSVLFAIVSRGPGPGFRSVVQRLKEGTQDLLSTSPRRVYALSQLAVQEAIRRKVFVAFVLYILVLLFAAWFMDPAQGTQPARLYLDNVLTYTTWLVILIAVFLAVFSLPADITNHTIYTVVTKPVRPTEIVLGRIFGFTAIGSMMLIVMALVNYFFVTRSLDHQHTIRGAGLKRVEIKDGDYYQFTGTTNKVDGHAHEFKLRIAGGDEKSRGKTEVVHEHYHNISEADPAQRKSGKIQGCESTVPRNAKDAPDGSRPIRVTSKGHGLENGEIVKITGVRGTTEANSTWVVEDVKPNTFVLKQSTYSRIYNNGGQWRTIRYEVSGPQDMLVARVPVHAHRLQFRDVDGSLKNEGTNVGFEWGYRGHFAGGTESGAVLRFRGLDRSLFRDRADGIKLEMKFSVYRTVKGDITTPVGGEIRFRNPKTGFRSDRNIITFDARKEFSTQQKDLPDKIPGRRSENAKSEPNATLFRDYVHNGELIMEISCTSPAQYLGVAKHDVYFVADQAVPFVNFMKGHLSIWLLMILMISFGVMFSTFLNGFVALLATAAVAIGGYCRGFIYEIIDPGTAGGASFESIYRVWNRSAMTTDLPPGFTTDVIVFLDSGVRFFLTCIVQGIPNISRLDSVDYVAQGFSIPWNNLAIQFVTVLGFLIPLCLLAHYIIKGREIAR